MKLLAMIALAIVGFGSGAAARAQTLDFQCYSGVCYADILGFPTPPVRYEWVSWPSGAVNFPSLCGTGDWYCAFTCPSPLFPTGYISVSVYDGLDNLIGSDSSAVCN
ncbi:MAG TPA: hypothetical protein VMR06_14470 [Dokdonella sp.]|uniref:hypothetical protein n=1 Tax=Dokdonella sp. TaxID=2291710 RepID=UPI002C972973|nr:hypothetical protein [Dokdonella sp.]HUD43192.1 hypothetical protein [Dokdonella sp.]